MGNTLEILLNYPRTRAKNARHVQFVTDLREAVPQEMATKYVFTPQWTAVDAATSKEITGFKAEKGYLKTTQIEATDRKRDNTFKLYRGIALLYEAYGVTEEEQQAGQTLAFAFREAGDVTISEYGSETAEITDLVEKFRTEPYVSALATIGLEGAADALEAVNKEFNTVYLERNEEERNRAFSTNMKSLRAASDTAIETLFRTINALYAVNELVTKDEETRTDLGKIINDVNTLIVRFRKTVSGSSSTGDSEEEEPVKPEITEVYSKVEDPHDPTGITRGKETIMKWVGDFELVNETGDGPGKIIVKDNFTGVEEEVPAEDILSRSNTGCEFIMIRDFAEGEYKIRIETYVDGSLLKLEYGKIIKLV